jgi:DNA (cytosine-5)-methyltransferase 1
VTGSSESRLPTPTARDWKSSASNLHGSNARPLNEVAALLPTVLASDGPHGGPNKRDSSGNYALPGVAARLPLFGTPLASSVAGHGDLTNRRNLTRIETQVADLPTNDQWVSTAGKDYGPAVRRWEEISGAVAPAPAVLGPRGGKRLNAEFAEWMMGLPAGHVTSPEIGLTWQPQIERIGNGVMPQQAYTAFAFLLGSLDDNPAPCQTQTVDEP